MEEDNVEGHADPNHPAEKMETDVGVPDNTEKSGNVGESEEASRGEEHVK